MRRNNKLSTYVYTGVFSLSANEGVRMSDSSASNTHLFWDTQPVVKASEVKSITPAVRPLLLLKLSPITRCRFGLMLCPKAPASWGFACVLSLRGR